MRHYSSQRNIVWTVLFSILLVVTLTACGDANNVTGPPPPVPLSPDAKLSSLTVNTGPLDPVFSGDIANYAVNVATSVGSVTVTARPQNANANMTIDGQATASGQARTIALDAAGSNTPIPIVVTAVNGSQNTYIVTVNRAARGGDNNLQSLSLSPGSLAPPFTASTTSYTVDVATSVTSVTVTARAQDAEASVSINGQATASGQARTITLGAAGSNTPIPIVVTAPNGSQKTYLVTVIRAAPGGNNNLQSLSVSPGSLASPFAASTTSYTVDVATSVTSITVTSRAQDTGATVSINGQTTTSRPVALGAPGSSTPISLVVTAPNGSQKTYLVTINRAALGGNNNLRSLSVTPGPLVPVFAASTTSYTVNVASNVASVTVTAQPQDAGASVSINGQPTTSQSITLGGPGSSTPISLVVTAPNGSQKTYLVTVNRTALGGNNNLQSLTVTPGPLVPAFAASATSYTLDVATSVTNVTVTARAQDAGASVSINGQPTTS
ncbi:MAG: cadherin-like beta sandwich domain-containing protein, partial [Nitrospiraceae bacterium]|nr:cadherin-like beta sandwich domain-containing protein [Nitrospiraceae bacterium]